MAPRTSSSQCSTTCYTPLALTINSQPTNHTIALSSDLLALAPSRSFDGWAGRRWTMSCRDACPWRWASLRLASLQPQELDWTQQWMGDLLAWRLYDVAVARFSSSVVNSAHPRLRACCCSPDGGDFNEEQARLRRGHQCFLRRHPDWPRCHQGTVF